MKKIKKVAEKMLTKSIGDTPVLQVSSQGPPGYKVSAPIHAGGDLAAAAHVAHRLGVAVDDFCHLLGGVSRILNKSDNLFHVFPFSIVIFKKNPPRPFIAP